MPRRSPGESVACRPAPRTRPPAAHPDPAGSMPAPAAPESGRLDRRHR